MRYLVQVLAVLLLMGLAGSHAFAADTLELFDPGVSDFEFYFSVGGMGKEGADRTIGGEFLLGAGLTEGLSGQIFGFGEGDHALVEATGGFGFGIFATPVNRDHLDLDIGINLVVESADPGTSFGVVPFVEINLDSDPEMNGYGAYLMLEEGLTGRSNADGTSILTPVTFFLLGAYYTVEEGQQLFLCYDMSFNHRNAADERRTEVGGIALGYNSELTDNVELISEVMLDIPQDDEEWGVDLMLGFIATLP